MTQKPDFDLAAVLAAAGFGTVGTDIRVGEPLSPTEAGAAGVKLWVYAEGGPAPTGIMFRDPSDGHIHAEWDVTVKVRVRDVVGGKFDDSQALARSVLRALTFKTISGYDDCSPDLSDPWPLGQNEADGYEWGLAFSLKWTA